MLNPSDPSSDGGPPDAGPDAGPVAGPSVLSEYGRSPDFPGLDIGRLPARVVRVDRGGYMVATPDTVERCHPSPQEEVTGPPVTGDWIVARREPGLGLVVDAIMPRSSEITRTDPSGTSEQALVANVDTLFVLHGLDRPLRVGRVERLCLIARNAGATPVVVITKTDLDGSPAAEAGLLQTIEAISRVVRDVDIVPVSSTTGTGIGLLDPYLGDGDTIALMAESGAGKSTLINRLVGQDVQVTGETREGDSKGRHTTTSRDLVPLPSGAVVIDTPGLRAVLMTGDQTGLGHSYADVEDLFERCQFRDCSHGVEPGCGVAAALATGELEETRWAGYQNLLTEMANEARRADQRARRAEDKDAGRRYRKLKDRTDKDPKEDW